MKKRRERRPLPQSEWNFDNLPVNAVEPCFFYEYARERSKQCPAVAELVKEYERDRRLPKGERRTVYFLLKAPRSLPELLGANELVRHSFPHLGLDYFPKVPWQEIDEELRGITSPTLAMHFRSLNSDRLSICTLRELQEANITSIEVFKMCHQSFSHSSPHGFDQTEYGFFAIDWNYPDPEIRRAFESWLYEQRSYRKTAGLSKPKIVPKGRGGFQDKLRWLGALRVRDYYTPAELGGYAGSNVNVAAPYSHLPDLYANAKRAEQLLVELFPAASS